MESSESGFLRLHGNEFQSWKAELVNALLSGKMCRGDSQVNGGESKDTNFPFKEEFCDNIWEANSNVH